MKYYLSTVQYNKVAHAENREATKMRESKAEIEQLFYEQVGKDMKNENLGGSINIVYDSEGRVEVDLTKKWGFMEEDAPIEE